MNQFLPLVLALGLATPSVAADEPPQSLDQMLMVLSGNPDDAAMREKIIAAVKRMKEPPPLPEEANRRMVRAKTMAELAAQESDFERVVSELKAAVLAAPWWETGYHNLAVAQEKAKDFRGAIATLKLFVLATDDPAKAETARNKMYKLEVFAEQAGSGDAPAASPAASAAVPPAPRPAADHRPLPPLASDWPPFKGTGNVFVEEGAFGETQTETTRKEGDFEDFHGVRAHYDETTFKASGPHSMVMRWYYGADERGVVMLGSRSSSRYKFDESESATESETRYSPPLVLLPRDVKVGTRWEARTAVTSHTKSTLRGPYPSESESDSPMSMVTRNEVVRKESVKVPAGTYDCFVIEQVSETATEFEGVLKGSRMTSKIHTTLWWSPKAGFVKSEQSMENVMIDKEGKETPSKGKGWSRMKEARLASVPWASAQLAPPAKAPAEAAAPPAAPQ